MEPFSEEGRAKHYIRPQRETLKRGRQSQPQSRPQDEALKSARRWNRFSEEGRANPTFALKVKP